VDDGKTTEGTRENPCQLLDVDLDGLLLREEPRLHLVMHHLPRRPRLAQHKSALVQLQRNALLCLLTGTST